MTRQLAQIEVSNFTKGLITEAGPLTFPENSSLSEQNFELNRDGSRDRRLGMDYESDYQIYGSAAAAPEDGDIYLNTFVWENAGGSSEDEILVVQLGNILQFFDNTQSTTSGNRLLVNGISQYVVPTSKINTYFGFASVDGTLVCASGAEDIVVFDYNGTSISVGFKRLRIRDLFGVEDIDSGTGKDLHAPGNLAYRPREGEVEDPHLYNLNNQSWGNFVPSSFIDTGGGHGSPLYETSHHSSLVPSNADVMHSSVLFEPSTDPIERFNPNKWKQEQPVIAEAPKGFFVIDALARGASRYNEYQANFERITSEFTLNHPNIAADSLPQDYTPGGASVLEEFSGRLFYAGFPGTVIGADSRSPKLSSYIMFSQLVKSPGQIANCYQAGDPTDSTVKDLVATDGGFLKVQGAYGINRLVNIGTGLVILATNGVWMLKGESGIGFSALSYEVVKLSDHGCTAPASAVVVNDALIYWGESGIYSVSRNEFGEYIAQNISAETIQTFYDDIPESSKRLAIGAYDSYARRVRWLYNNSLTVDNPSSELILDVGLGAFYPSVINEPSGGAFPVVAAPYLVPPYTLGLSTEKVLAGGVQVQVSGVDVVVTDRVRKAGVREVKYLVIPSLTEGTLNFTFGLYKDTEFLDWKSFDGTGVDADAFLITGYVTGGESMRYKQVPSLITHLKRTEDGFVTDESGDLVPTNQSSCLIQAQWDWCDSATSNRWGKEFQAYQYPRQFIPESATSDYDFGHSTIVTRRKLRGKGRALSLLIKSEPKKDLRLVGWGMQFIIQGRS